MAEDSIPSTTKATITKQPFYYFSIKLVSSQPRLPRIDQMQYRNYLSKAFEQWLGVIGSGIHVDMLSFEYPDATIRVPFDNYKSVWQALTIYSFKISDDAEGRFQVLRNSPYAMGIASSSRPDPHTNSAVQ